MVHNCSQFRRVSLVFFFVSLATLALAEESFKFSLDTSPKTVIRVSEGLVEQSTDGRSFVKMTEKDAVLVPAHAKVKEINQILKAHRVVFFSPKAVYEIDDSVVIPSNTVVNFQGATLKLADQANTYLLRNEDLITGDKNIVLMHGRLDGNGTKQTRRYNGDYKTGYFGFGAVFSKVDRLVMDDFDVIETNAWGIAYFLCETVSFSNFRFDQTIAEGKNGDGITGIARRVRIKNVSGYTNDDIVAISTGKATLQGHDAGISNDENIDVEEVVIENINAIEKGGKAPHVGVGIYATAGRKVKSIRIHGLRGNFDHYAYRIQNYWPKEGESYFEYIQITDLNIQSRRHYGALIDVTSAGAVMLEGHKTSGSEVGSSLLILKNARVESLSFQDCSMLVKEASQSSWLNFDPKGKSSVGRSRMDGCVIQEK